MAMHSSGGKRAARPGLLLALAATVAGLGNGAFAAESGRGVRITGADYLGDLPTVVAEARDLFSRQGLDARIDYGASGKRGLERLRGGETDFALMALTPLVLDRLADATPGEREDPVILASLVHSTRINALVARPGSGIGSAADLAGRRVGLVEGTNAEYAWWLYATYHGHSHRYARLDFRREDELADALVAGEIDAALLWEPWIARVEQRLGQPLEVLDRTSVYNGKWVLTTRRSTVADQRALCRAVLRAYRAAIGFIERRPEQAIRLYARHAGLPEEAIAARWTALDYDLRLDWSTISALQQQFRWARLALPAHDRDPAAIDVLSMLAPGPLRDVAAHALGLPLDEPLPEPDP